MKITFGVYEQYWDAEQINPTDNKLIWNAEGATNNSVFNIKNELHRIVGINKGDGFSINLTMNKEVLNVNVFLFAIKEEKEEVDYIKEFFNNSFKGNFREDKHSVQRNNESEKYYVSFSLFDDSNLEGIILLLQKSNIEVEVASVNLEVFERGASGYLLQVILDTSSVLGGIASVIKIQDYLKKIYGQDVKVQGEDEKILQVVQTISKRYVINEHDLKMCDFETTEDGCLVFLKSRYRNFEVECDRQMNIKNIQVKNIQQTSI